MALVEKANDSNIAHQMKIKGMKRRRTLFRTVIDTSSRESLVRVVSPQRMQAQEREGLAVHLKRLKLDIPKM
jgi:hypothetical protein